LERYANDGIPAAGSSGSARKASSSAGSLKLALAKPSLL
jgi:hypothetical protein